MTVITLCSTLFHALTCGAFDRCSGRKRGVASAHTHIRGTHGDEGAGDIKHHQPQKKRLAVVGASFGGLAVLRELSDDDAFDITVVEPKDYVEYTPSTLKAMVHESFARQIQVPLRTAIGARVTHVRACVEAVHTEKEGTGGVLRVKYADGTVGDVPFDMCVLATGSSYPSAAKANVDDISGSARLAAFQSLASRLRSAGSVAIVGGGPVGVELAAELVTARPECRVKIFTAAPRLLDHFPLSISKAAEEWLARRGVESIFEQRVENIQDHTSSTGNTVTFTARGIKMHADVLVLCAGARAESGYMLRSTPELKDSVQPSGRITVDTAFRVAGAGTHHIFAIGDVAAHPLFEPAMAHTAEKHAECVSHTLRGLAHAAPGEIVAPCAYPEGLTGVPSAPVIAAISLGPYESLLFFDWLILVDPIIGSRLGAVLKWTIEKTKLLQMQRHPMGVAFWKFGDAMSVLMHRYVTAASRWR